MKTIRIMLSMLLAVVTCSSLAQGVIIYKSNGTQEKLPYTAVDSIIMYYGDMNPVPIVEAKAIDLGLPSGTQWASHNVGATVTEEIGGYYAWGETEEKVTYSWDNYMCTSSSDCTTSADPPFADGTLSLKTQYGVVYGVEGNISGTKYDVATQTWGDSWAMPTAQQYKELFNNCTRSTLRVNDVYCVEFTGPNGNSVIFPIEHAGYKQNAQLVDAESILINSYYWTSELSQTFRYQGVYAEISSTGQSAESSYDRMERYIGMLVRAVKNPSQNNDDDTSGGEDL